jgi:hypothetical protein
LPYWQDSPNTPGDDWASDIAVDAGKVFMSGARTNTAGNQDFLVRAYNALNGGLWWESVVDKGGQDAAAGIAANSSIGVVFAVGSGATTLPKNSSDSGVVARSLVRAYNMNTGALAWEQFGSSLGESAAQAVVAGERLLTVGVTNYCPHCGGEGQTFQDILIRAYDAK